MRSVRLNYSPESQFLALNENGHGRANAVKPGHVSSSQGFGFPSCSGRWVQGASAGAAGSIHQNCFQGTVWPLLSYSPAVTIVCGTGKSRSWLSLSYHRMQKLSGTVQGFCCLPTKHSLINLDRRAGEDSEALNQMLQLCLLAKGSAVWTESINSVYGTGRSHTLKSGRCSCWEEPLGSAGQFTALTQCWMCAVIHGTTWIRRGCIFLPASLLALLISNYLLWSHSILTQVGKNKFRSPISLYGHLAGKPQAAEGVWWHMVAVQLVLSGCVKQKDGCWTHPVVYFSCISFSICLHDTLYVLRM